MTLTACGYCEAPIRGHGLTGRARPDRPAAHYCCSGCLGLGERPASSEGIDPAWLRLAIGAYLAAQSMVLGLAISLTPPEGPARLAVQGVVLGSTAIVAALLGGPLARASWDRLRRGQLTVEAMFLLGIAGATGASVQSMIAGHGPIYFEVVSILLVIYTLNLRLGARARASAMATTRAWSGDLQTCRRLGGEVVDVRSIEVGDLVEVRAGERIAVDGMVVEGIASVREAPMTGEALAVVRREGDSVWAGTTCEDATIRVRATAPGTARSVDRLIEAVERARATPTTLQGQADRLAGAFVPIVLVVAALTFLGWARRDGWEVGLFRSLSVLLVACPCALGLATPIALWSALGRLASRGLVARDGEIVERLARADSVVFDKTGTLSEERFALVDFSSVGDFARDELLAIVAAVEAHAPHPIARAFAEFGSRPDAIAVLSHRIVAGCGIEATFRDPGGTTRTIRVGRREWLAPDRGFLASQNAAQGHQILVEVDGQLAGIATLVERARDSAAQAIEELRAMGLAVGVMTGDSSAPADWPEATVGMTPEAKRRAIADRVAAGGRPLFVGDGINDAPALATAFAGIAMASGTDMAVEAASATLFGGDLRAIPWAIATARQTLASVRLTLLVAAGYNAAGIALAASGRLHPIAAASLMVGSSLWVAWRSSRIFEISGCDCPEPAPAAGRRASWIALIHGLALAAHGPLLAALMGLDRGGVIWMTLGFAILAGLASFLYLRWESIPHGLDMAFGMLTLGNFGMAAGWWADAGFRPIATCGCEQGWRGLLASPGMWIGMLVMGNLAMVTLRRRGSGAGGIVAGNVGMAAGMMAGGWLASRAAPLSTAAAFAGMGLGMAVGHLAGCLKIRSGLARDLRHAVCGRLGANA